MEDGDVMKYGKDYGMKVDVPWYIKCPILNWFFNTCKIRMTLTTFAQNGGPLTGLETEIRIPFKDKGDYINSVLKVDYCIPDIDYSVGLGFGLYVQVHLVDVNHKKVFDRKRGTSTNTSTRLLETGYWSKPDDFNIWFNVWRRDYIDITFNKSDFGRK